MKGLQLQGVLKAHTGISLCIAEMESGEWWAGGKYLGYMRPPTGERERARFDEPIVAALGAFLTAPYRDAWGIEVRDLVYRRGSIGSSQGWHDPIPYPTFRGQHNPALLVRLLEAELPK